MKVLILSVSLLAAAVQQCTKKAVTDGFPSCIRQKIDSIKAQPKWNPPAEVWAYSYNGKTVYLFSADCCDQYTTVYDANCNFICAPSGGLTGKGDRKCEDFATVAKQLRLVWKDQR
jgi:hypothetical protein